MFFVETDPHITNSDIPSNFKSSCKKPRGDTLICRFLLGIWPYTQREMQQILLAYGLPKETVAVINMLYKKRKVKVRNNEQQ